MPTIAENILTVLGDPEFDWTTFNGLLKATELNPDEVRDALKELVKQGQVISTIEPRTGEIVFTTKKLYRRSHTFLDDSITAGTGYVAY
jgi:hypothetical protein